MTAIIHLKTNDGPEGTQNFFDKNEFKLQDKKSIDLTLGPKNNMRYLWVRKNIQNYRGGQPYRINWEWKEGGLGADIGTILIFPLKTKVLFHRILVTNVLWNNQLLTRLC